MREPSDEEIEDARIETRMREEADRRLMRAHPFNPACSCRSCYPDLDEDDQTRAEQDELDAQMRYDRNHNTEWGW